MNLHRFLQAKISGLSARLSRLARIDNAFVGLRPQDMRYAPSTRHFEAANARLARVERRIRARFAGLRDWDRRAPQRVLIDIALVERELDRARRLFGMFYEVFAQRGTSYGPALAAHDAIAEDCYRAIRQAAPRIFDGPLLKPVCYMEHGYSPATMRRGVQLSRLLGEQNPFPLIRIPWDRDQPWQSVFLHEVAHNLQADLGIWQENRQAVLKRIMGSAHSPFLAGIYGRWHKEIFADLAAILLGGPAAAWGMADFLAHPQPRTMTYRPGGAHPTAYLRVYLLAEMLRRLGFGADAAKLLRVWQGLYRANTGHRIPAPLMASAPRLIPEVVDEIAFQTRRNLAQRALVDIIPFRPDDEAAIRDGARRLAAERDPELAPRHLVSAAHYALEGGGIAPQRLAQCVIAMLTAHLPPQPAAPPRLRLAA
ncbi:hypothetical protein [Burkholderia ubonensis]|uniref:hypothetical protein n=1 Tax=Burkholderia ubonensis TaxID=101571 RepID=UPI00075EE9D2|nr:hypothetical protein [Burkholderia ubonensis]KVO54308.1 hypothetical protein WJ77_16315 [Burkholderia ubonensis]KVP74389.1 hypothetical protein WJ94_00575 [Burkholderia ubonensis]KVR53568.1 hypothetical protein WK19_00415 [Burkholderia ubonensis]KVX39201.1 hypothetical protein WL04_10325 [Burkholderia ubonensis]KWD39613.1 hypothetical protein WL65_27330 [Burkholderia ubonensis]